MQVTGKRGQGGHLLAWVEQQGLVSASWPKSSDIARFPVDRGGRIAAKERYSETCDLVQGPAERRTASLVTQTVVEKNGHQYVRFGDSSRENETVSKVFHR